MIAEEYVCCQRVQASDLQSERREQCSDVQDMWIARATRLSHPTPRGITPRGHGDLCQAQPLPQSMPSFQKISTVLPACWTCQTTCTPQCPRQILSTLQASKALQLQKVSVPQAVLRLLRCWPVLQACLQLPKLSQQCRQSVGHALKCMQALQGSVQRWVRFAWYF